MAEGTATAPVTGEVLVRLPDDEMTELAEHAEALRIPVRTVLRRAALTAVRVTRVGTTPEQLITGAASAIGRDFPTWGSYLSRMRVAESMVRWLLARCAVVALPAPLTDHGVWVVQLTEGEVIEIRAGRDDHGTPGVRLSVGGRVFSPTEFRAVASAGLAACEQSTLQREEVMAETKRSRT